MPKTLEEEVNVSEKIRKLISNNLKKILTVGAITGALTFAGAKALASKYNPSQPQEPTRAGQVMMPEDTTYEHYELIGEKNNGFEEGDNDWVATIVNPGPYNIATNHHRSTDLWPAFKGDYCARLKVSNKDAFNPAVQIEIDLSSEDTIKFGELDSLLSPIFQEQYHPSEPLDVTIDLIGEKGEILDTLTYNYGQDMEDSEHRKIIANLKKPPYYQWSEQKFREDLIKAIKDNNLENHYVKSLRVYVETKEMGDQSTNILLDESYLHATRQIITGVGEEPPRQVTPRLKDIITNGTARININYEAPANLEIYNPLGQRVWSEGFGPNSDYTVELTKNQLGSAGLYFVRIISGNKVQTGKLVLMD